MEVGQDAEQTKGMNWVGPTTQLEDLVSRRAPTCTENGKKPGEHD
jgi:hypothetical protein